MTINLKIFDCKYDRKGRDMEDYWFSGDISICRIVSKTNHKSYVDMANWLDRNKRFKNHVMYIRSRKQTLPAKVVFDGVFTWAEGHGYI